MRVLGFTGIGGPEVLQVREEQGPETPSGDDVVIEVAAAGVNRADVHQREGRYPPPPGAPAWPGLEVSGTVLAAGPAAPWSPGDRVAALLDGGGYAEQVVVTSALVLPAPAALPLPDAAALPEAACTVWATLVMSAGLRAGETVLVHGGSGGIGTTAIQVAAALGARVVATAGGPERARRCAELGADVVVDHRGEDFVEAVREATQGRGADVVLDMVGAAYLEQNVAALAVGGRLEVIGLQKGRRAELDLGALMARRASVHAATLRARPTAEKAAIVTAVREHVWPMVASGAVRPVVHERIPLAEGRRAHELLESGAVFGKLLLVP
ncbi:NAD(P)H-quinone oxidoreductase [Actinotalea fermentans]|uniref:NAD(P)H quinone oxidoreductase n=1 Tax=Actinotalea fermentans TaxID=43671 RepID=A0A511YZ04_9CELL|nr:NAD(P)H-quinone oxidoreductase [Actinotalea fermentans]KGM15519.1 NADPH:quinone oxidoreductase [Actinotalea fermentans ATCC 43279 = JCM 9966 = DSM 3133]GEN80430.1 NAD(P)H quinone oxidoreductase [Actinotalea fermentans]